VSLVPKWLIFEILCSDNVMLVDGRWLMVNVID